MSDRYPHMRTEGDFPNVGGVNVYKYDNQLDYGRYDYTQMQICVCRVPWDMGEAHVGQRVVSGIGNVVYFESDTARDAWFDALPDTECFRWETKYKELHRDFKLNVPLPFDVAARYNYVYVKYSLFANDDSTLEYESTAGVRKWFYFVREVNFIAPNTTELVLMDDAWQTWIYDVDITGMMLERGHAPVFATTADTYLENPIANNSGLLCEDVNYGDLQKVVASDSVTLNSANMYACLALTCNPWNTWGTKADNGRWNQDNWQDSTWQVAASGYHSTTDSVPNFRVIALPATDLNDFLDAVGEQIPQFKQTIQGVFFVSGDYLTFGNAGQSEITEDGSFKLAGHTVYLVRRGTETTLDLTTLSKDRFGYGNHYRNLAKLYTYPYSAIEVCDEKGNKTLVKIEETSGKINLTIAVSLAFPYINITGNLVGVGGVSVGNLKFANITESSFDFDGRWYDHVLEWKIPCFMVYVDAADVNDYAEHYDRVQSRTDYTIDYETARNNYRVTRFNARELNSSWKNNVDEENLLQNGTTNDSGQLAAGNYGNNRIINAMNKNNATDTAKADRDNSEDTAQAVYILANATRGAVSYSIAIDNQNMNLDLYYAAKELGAGIQKAAIDSVYAYYTTSDNSFVSTMTSGVSSVVNGAFSGAQSGFVAGNPLAAGHLAGAGATVGGISFGLSAITYAETVSNNKNYTANVINANYDNLVYLYGGSYSSTTYSESSKYNANVYTAPEIATDNKNFISQEQSVAIGIQGTKVFSKQLLNKTSKNSANYLNQASAQTAYNVVRGGQAKTINSNTGKPRNYDKIFTGTATRSYRLVAGGGSGNESYVGTATRTQEQRNRTVDNTLNVRNKYNKTAFDYKNDTYNRTAAYQFRGAGAYTFSGPDTDTDVSNDCGITGAGQNLSNAEFARLNKRRAISNRVASAKMKAATIFGSVDNAETATTRPQALFANVVTQSESAIANAGDEFLRYGYRYDRQWAFDGNWNIGTHFTYWKLKDFWVKGLQVPDLYMDKLRFFLLEGVTVWRKPEDIGNISIYENGI